MGDLTKWESKSVKGAIIAPVVGVLVMLVIILIMSLIRPPPLDLKKKAVQENILEVEDENAVDWNNF